MNGGVIGLLLVGVALGVASVACWRFMGSRTARYAPGVLAALYYVAVYAWPHQAILAARAGKLYPEGDQVRALLLGCALILAILELSTRLARAVRNNAALRAENAQVRRELAQLKGET